MRQTVEIASGRDASDYYEAVVRPRGRAASGGTRRHGRPPVSSTQRRDSGVLHHGPLLAPILTSPAAAPPELRLASLSDGSPRSQRLGSQSDEMPLKIPWITRPPGTGRSFFKHAARCEWRPEPVNADLAVLRGGRRIKAAGSNSLQDAVTGKRTRNSWRHRHRAEAGHGRCGGSGCSEGLARDYGLRRRWWEETALPWKSPGGSDYRPGRLSLTRSLGQATHSAAGPLAWEELPPHQSRAPAELPGRAALFELLRPHRWVWGAANGGGEPAGATAAAAAGSFPPLPPSRTGARPELVPGQAHHPAVQGTSSDAGELRRGPMGGPASKPSGAREQGGRTPFRRRGGQPPRTGRQLRWIRD